MREDPHAWGTPLPIAAALRFAATLPSTPATVTRTGLAQEPVFEFDCTPHPIREALLTDALRPQAGCLRVPTDLAWASRLARAVLEHFEIRH